jgi:hypothetical protein
MRWFQIALVLALIAVPVNARKLARPPTTAELIGRWAGYTEDDLNFVQCDLRDGGAGSCAVSWLNGPPKLYRIQHWALSVARLSFDVAPVDSDTEPIFLRGSAGSQLRLVIGGAGWRRELKLYRASDLQNNLAFTAARLDAAIASER